MIGIVIIGNEEEDNMDFSQQEDNLKSREFREDFAREVLGDRYNILKRLYEEEFETVYIAEAKDSSVPTKYLIQQFTPQYLSQAQLAAAKDLFSRESSVLETLGSHPQIPSIHDYFETQGQFFVVQEFILGQSLQDELRGAEPYSETEAIAFLNDILPVLQFIHQNNYIHRDIKPSHLMRNSVDKKIYLTNFYAIKEKINPQNLDITGQFMPHITVGTQGYIAIEQHLGKPEFCSDIYALGIVIIQALTKIELTQFEYDDDNNPVWHNLLPNISEFNPQFLDIIDTMVRCNHRKRYQSANAILASLKQLQSPQGLTENSSVVENLEAKNQFTEGISRDQDRESTAPTTEHTLIQQNPEPRLQTPEHTLIISNSEAAPQSPEHTLILGNSEANAQSPEHTLIIQNEDIESTRIIDSRIPRDRNNNIAQDNNKSKLKIITIIGAVLAIVTIFIILFISKDKQNSAPKTSSLIPNKNNETFILQY